MLRTCYWLAALALTFCAPLALAVDGIVIGPPKIYDDRALQIMLDDLECQLGKTQVVDQAKLEAQLGVNSGMSRRASSLSFSPAGPATPGIVTENTPNIEGQLVPSKQTVTQAVSTPAVPNSPTTSALATVPAPGVNVESLLAEQINLTYRIYNLRLLLNRSISDRLLVPAGLKDRLNPAKPLSRKQVLVGFSISIQPNEDTKGREAYVLIEVGALKKAPPQVVSMLPQEKTYNISSISDKAVSFGFVIPISALSLGFAVGGQRQTLFLYRDADTLARLDGPGRIKIESEDVDTEDFGWSFRPVLGRDYVEPGIRQVFVNLALDEDENATSFEPLQFSFYSGWRDLKDKMAVKNGALPNSIRTFKRLDVPDANTIRQGLGAKITKVAISPFNDSSAIVSLGGTNFFPGTAILIGDEIISEANPKLTIPADDALTFITTLANLESGLATLYGRYGLPVPIENHAAPEKHDRMLKLSVATKPAP